MEAILSFTVLAALILVGVALGLINVYRSRHPTADIPPGLVWRLAVSLIFLGSLLALFELGDFWLSAIVLVIAGASLYASRLLFPGQSRWHWPTVIVAFVGVPAVAFAFWATFLRH